MKHKIINKLSFSLSFPKESIFSPPFLKEGQGWFVKSFNHYKQTIFLRRGAGGGFLFLFLLFLVTSCGEYWEGTPVSAHQMKLPKKVVNIMVGDKYPLPVLFAPDDVSNQEIWWQTKNDDIATMVNDSVLGVSEGLTVAYAMSVSDRLQDSCLVNVIPEAYLNPKDYPYDMVIYADVTIHGKKYTADDEDSLIIAAYNDYELRGIGKMRSANGKPYMELRIWSPFEYGDWIDLMCIYRGRPLIELFPGHLRFDGETHGTLSNLYPLVLDDNAREYFFGYDLYNFGYDDTTDDDDNVIEITYP